MDQHATDLLTPDEGRAQGAGENERWLARRDRVPAVWTRYTDLVVERGEGSWI